MLHKINSNKRPSFPPPIKTFEGRLQRESREKTFAFVHGVQCLVHNSNRVYFNAVSIRRAFIVTVLSVKFPCALNKRAF